MESIFGTKQCERVKLPSAVGHYMPLHKLVHIQYLVFAYTHALFIIGPDGMTLAYTTKRIWYDFRSHIGDPLRIS